MNQETNDVKLGSVNEDEASVEPPVDNQKQSFVKQRGSRWKVSFGRVLLTVAAVVSLFLGWFWWSFLRMPGESFQRAARQQLEENDPVGLLSNDSSPNPMDSNPAARSADESSLQEMPADPVADLQQRLSNYVIHLSETVGERNLGNYQSLCEAADYIDAEFAKFGYPTERQTYRARGLDCFNIEAEIKGTTAPDQIVIIGAHYDSVVGTPGANDNGSGVAAMLALAEHFRDLQPERTLRFVAFANEEPPYFQTENEMGSWVYARRCRQRDENVVAVLSLETMGYFTDQPKSQKYPGPLALLYPSTGNFVGFVSNLDSAQLQRRVIKTFREHAKIPSEGASLPQELPGVGWSDHWSFWQEEYVGVMVTDTAPFRYPHYHLESDTPDKLNYPEFAKVVEGLKFVIVDLCKAE